MRAISLLRGFLGMGLGLGLMACTGSGDDYASVAAAPLSADASVQDGAIGDATLTEGAAPDGGAGIDAASDAPGTLAALRVANWSASAPTVDFCIAPHGTNAFRRPVLVDLAVAISEAGLVDAGSSAVAFPQASAYFLVAPGQYDARLVPGGAPDCSAKIVPDATALPVFDAGQQATIALIGALDSDGGKRPLSIAAYFDDIYDVYAPPPSGGAADSGAPGDGGAATDGNVNAVAPLDSSVPPGRLAVRAINAKPGGLQNIDIGIVSSVTDGAQLVPFFLGIPYGASSRSASNFNVVADPNGYAPAAPLVATDLIAVRAMGAPNNLALGSGVSAAAGAVLTFVVVDTLSPSKSSPTAQLVECLDNVGTLGLTGSCAVVSQ